VLWKNLITLLLLAISGAAPAANPVKLAAFARLEVRAEPSVGRLDGGVNYGGYLSRMFWTTGAIERTYSALTPILHFEWRQIDLVFTPQSNGWVNLIIDTQWDWSAESNAVYKQEVDWDALSADATFIPNSSFELLSGGAPLHWAHPWGGQCSSQTSPTRLMALTWRAFGVSNP
jgi:hypothetical protein